ncbi:alpha/beta hydrolase family protein [Rhodococcus sp. SMB37]|uniref:alpha/beta hydrolase n=1 Tax=Rhodococcus sp. SMB37 TaxID=2512213 RepID=UPI0006CFF5C1|nr:alpha/beta hydrolase [Rhodococcus sp. SMB37]TCN49794.1 alpha/beta hydrolase family protein [Rhodococcus sp. SMB37]
MNAADVGELDDTVAAHTVEVHGVQTSALCSYVERPRAVIVALHGGATTSRYFDLEGRPELSLLRTAATLGYTVLAIDRPGYADSFECQERFDDPATRVDAAYGAVDALLEGCSRGAGVFLLAHSAGCDLGLRMAADPRGASLLGVELAGTGTRKQREALEIIKRMRTTRNRGAIRDLLWYPEELYPPEVRGGRSLTCITPRYEAVVAAEWPRDFMRLAPEVRIPVRYTYAEHEKVWETDDDLRAEIKAAFLAAPRFVEHRQTGSGHNMSVGFAAAEYHRGVVAFVEACAARG